MKSRIKTSDQNPVFIRTAAFFLFAICSLAFQAQNTSFSANVVPIGGVSNVAFGSNALIASTVGFQNTATGNWALRFNTVGIQNTASGYASLFNSLGSYNTAVGYQSLYNTAMAHFNTGIGMESLWSNTTGYYNTALGMRADVGSGNLQNATAIGWAAVCNSSDAVQLGNSLVTQIFAGVGNNATVITGGLQVTGGVPAVGKVLTSDATGVATWQWPSVPNAWALIGNAGTVDGTNFMGTTDNIPLTFRVNNIRAGRIDHLIGNTFFGYQAASGTTSGGNNTAYGMNALSSNVTGNNNTALGYGANVSAGNLTNATAIGYNAAVTANNSIQLGNSSVTQIYAGTGTNATVITGGLRVTGGVLAAGQVLMSDASGNATWQLPAAASGGWTTLGNSGTIDGTNFIGTSDNVPLNFRINNIRAGRIDPTNSNLFFGGQATGVSYPVTGTGNSGYGHQSLNNLTTGANNTGIGGSALTSNTTGNLNTAIGYGADVSAGNFSNATAVGAYASVTANNSIQLGNSSVTTVRAGTGTNATVVAGGLQITGGTIAAGRVLTSDAFGVATWQAPGGGSGFWSLNGNSGTNPATDFVGTSDNVPLSFRVNNLKAGYISIATTGIFGTPEDGNTFLGSQAANATSTVTGLNWRNTIVGCRALFTSTSSAFNSAFGGSALYNSTSGSANTAIGYSVLAQTTIGNNNSCFGVQSFVSNITGSNLTGLGALSDVSTSSFSNATSIGYGAVVNASNKVRIGNGAVTVIEGNVAYTPSDGRFKNNISESDVVGLDFIKRLRPVVYNFDAKKFEEFLTKNMSDSLRKAHLRSDFGPATTIRQSGFIAQEVEQAANQAGYNFNGLHKPENEGDNYSLAYGQFVVPLVKGMQEQQHMIEELKKQLEEQKQLTSELQNRLGYQTGSANSTEASDGFWMSQNEPNPFSYETVVKFNLPQRFKTGRMVVCDLTGKQIFSQEIKERGTSSVVLSSENLTAGIYIYTMIGDGKILDSKKLIVSGK